MRILLYKNTVFYRTALTVVLLSLPLSIVAVAHADKVQLVLLITVDQLRGDFPERFRKRFGKDGFRYLMDNGVVYTNAHYRHSNTFTAVGHATLFTGGYTAQHGFPGNEWFDQQTGQRVYCVQDDRYGIIGRSAAETYTGASPQYLTSTTIGDELVHASGGGSRVFSISIKDRGAIIPGGHKGKAYWYDSRTGEFITSKYYYEDYPAWVRQWNQIRPADRYKHASWRLFQDRPKYTYKQTHNMPLEGGHKGLARSFPHPLGNPDAGDYYSGLRFTPMGDELTLDFVKALIEQERVGQGEYVDLLSVSFSATDYIGHANGPNSLEYEDNILHLDVTLAALFSFIDTIVGLEKTLIVLSSDHGVSDTPEHRRSLGFAAGRLSTKELITKADTALQRRYDSRENFVVGYWNSALYLNQETVQRLSLDIKEVEQILKEEVLAIEGVALAVTRTELLSEQVTNTSILNMLKRAFHPQRSGNLLIVQQPFWVIYPNNSAYVAMHGSPYNYDTYVPIMFAGPDISPRSVSRNVAPEDIAPTIAQYLGISPPTGSVGAVLTEVVKQGIEQ